MPCELSRAQEALATAQQTAKSSLLTPLRPFVLGMRPCGLAINREYWSGAVRSGEIARIGVYALEAYGIFKIGEIIGRRSLVGYNVN
ncbi:hypothetical protein D9758_017447 [Tetrapyrgos nigripes]|uniref:Uncharacterized protein n=1 Tax=Tetrapyrgos nigripes TaxID=182062 RepID=A0A8H5BZR9_9AGAR|nr:hypothetical protein D9758_017447 [Tetrapyrgos nigripes]